MFLKRQLLILDKQGGNDMKEGIQESVISRGNGTQAKRLEKFPSFGHTGKQRAGM
jgi:hypothetical protein